MKTMKTAISVSADIFQLSERLAKKMRLSRSAVFALGVKKLGEEMDEEEVIAKINAVCADVDTSIDPVWKELQGRTLQRNEW